MAEYKFDDFGKDVVIAGDNGIVYYIRRNQLGEFAVSREDFLSPDYAVIRGLLDQGTALAAIPTEEIVVADPAEGKGELRDDVAVACYLINLASLKVVQIYEEENSAATGNEPDVDVELGSGENLVIDPE